MPHTAKLTVASSGPLVVWTGCNLFFHAQARLGYLPKILKEAQETARVATKRERRADKNMRSAEQRARVAENNELQQFRRATEATQARA